MCDSKEGIYVLTNFITPESVLVRRPDDGWKRLNEFIDYKRGLCLRL